MKSFNELPEISEVTLGRAPFVKLLTALLEVFRRTKTTTEKLTITSRK